MNEANNMISGCTGGAAKTSPCVDICILVGRIVDLSEKLVGSVPPSDEKTTSSTLSSGLFGVLEASAQKVTAQVRRAHEALNRIERGLP